MIKANVSVGNLQKEFDIALGDILDAVDQNLEVVADTIHREAKTTTSFRDRSGRLRRSINLKKSKYKDGGYIVAATGPHAHLIEYGHVLIAWGRVTGRRVSARPFLRPAKEKGIRKAIELFKAK